MSATSVAPQNSVLLAVGHFPVEINIQEDLVSMVSNLIRLRIDYEVAGDVREGCTLQEIESATKKLCNRSDADLTAIVVAHGNNYPDGHRMSLPESTLSRDVMRTIGRAVPDKRKTDYLGISCFGAAAIEHAETLAEGSLAIAFAPYGEESNTALVAGALNDAEKGCSMKAGELYDILVYNQGASGRHDAASSGIDPVMAWARPLRGQE